MSSYIINFKKRTVNKNITKTHNSQINPKFTQIKSYKKLDINKTSKKLNVIKTVVYKNTRNKLLSSKSTNNQSETTSKKELKQYNKTIEIDYTNLHHNKNQLDNKEIHVKKKNIFENQVNKINSNNKILSERNILLKSFNNDNCNLDVLSNCSSLTNSKTNLTNCNSKSKLNVSKNKLKNNIDNINKISKIKKRIFLHKKSSSNPNIIFTNRLSTDNDRSNIQKKKNDNSNLTLDMKNSFNNKKVKLVFNFSANSLDNKTKVNNKPKKLNHKLSNKDSNSNPNINFSNSLSPSNSKYKNDFNYNTKIDNIDNNKVKDSNKRNKKKDISKVKHNYINAVITKRTKHNTDRNCKSPLIIKTNYSDLLSIPHVHEQSKISIKNTSKQLIFKNMINNFSDKIQRINSSNTLKTSTKSTRINSKRKLKEKNGIQKKFKEYPNKATIHTHSSKINIKFYNEKIIKNILSLSKKGYAGKGINKINQDKCFIFNNFMNNENYYYIGVCDGHGVDGHFAAEFLEKNLPYDLNTNLIQKGIKQVDNDKINDIKQTIINTFNYKHKQILSASNIDSSFSGSTCCSLIITPNKLICANTGDSRCILGQCINDKWSSVNLSRDHKPNEIDEKKRIYNNGGRVESFIDNLGNQVGPQRVWAINKNIPGLAMSRSLGDEIAHHYGVISEPEIIDKDICYYDKFIIVASDGLWEFISNEECVNIVKEYYLDNKIEECIEKLYQEASSRWILENETIDDISIIIAFF